MPAKSFDIRGHRVRTSSQRRYVVWAGRSEAFEGQRWSYVEQGYVPETFPAVTPYIVARSDSFATAQKRAAKARMTRGYVVIVDTTTGDKVEG